MLTVSIGGPLCAELFVNSIALFADMGRVWLSWEEKVDQDRHYHLGQGGDRTACREGYRQPGSLEEDGVSQSKGSMTTVRSLLRTQRNSGGHRIGTFMAFDTCQIVTIVNQWPRRARKEIKNRIPLHWRKY